MIISILNSLIKDTETIKNDQSVIKNAISEINNILEGVNGKSDKAEHPINDLEEKVGNKTQAEHQKEK